MGSARPFLLRGFKVSKVQDFEGHPWGDVLWHAGMARVGSRRGKVSPFADDTFLRWKNPWLLPVLQIRSVTIIPDRETLALRVISGRPNTTSSNGGSPFSGLKVQVMVPSPSNGSDQLSTSTASSQIEMDKEQGNHTLDCAREWLLIISSCKTREAKPTFW